MEQQVRHPLVLVVDDDVDTRELYGVILETVGYRVAAASRVADVSGAMARSIPDVVLTDWLLPDGTGLDVCELLQHTAATRDVPLIAATGLALSESQVAEARQRGCVSVLMKPIEPDAILEAIRAALVNATRDRVRATAQRMQRYARRAPFSSATEGETQGAAGYAGALLARAAASSGDRVAVLIADDSAHYVAASGTSALTGYEPDELAALSVWDLTPPSDTRKTEGQWQSFIASGMQEGLYTLRRRDGRIIQAQYCAIANIAPGLHVSALAVAATLPASLGAP
jgi:CheY-like chemotaxis protein